VLKDWTASIKTSGPGKKGEFTCRGKKNATGAKGGEWKNKETGDPTGITAAERQRRGTGLNRVLVCWETDR